MVKQQRVVGLFFFFPSLLQKVTCCKSEPVLPQDFRSLHFTYLEETILYHETLEFKV